MAIFRGITSSSIQRQLERRYRRNLTDANRRAYRTAYLGTNELVRVSAETFTPEAGAKKQQ